MRVKSAKNFRQADSRWGKLAYAKAPYYMSNAGCGPTACADIIVTNPKYSKRTPKTTRAYMIKHGYVVNGQGTRWAGIPACLQAYGFSTINHATMTGLFAELAKGDRLAVMLFRKGTKGGVTWTTIGHFVAVSGYKVKDGKHYLYTLDPGNRHNDGWHCYETQMKGLVVEVWSAHLKTSSSKATNNNNSTANKTNSTTYTSKVATQAKKRAEEKHKYKKSGWSWTDGIECHGFVGMIYKECGYNDIYKLIKTKGFYKNFDTILKKYKVGYNEKGMAESRLLPGDILMTNKASHHSAIYLGDGKVAEAVRAGTRVAKLGKRFRYAYRIPGVAVAKTTTKAETTEKKTMKGFDISYWQGMLTKANFEKAKNAGYDFVILRVGYNKELRKDSVFENNYKMAVQAGLKVGAYWYSTAVTEAQADKEAQYTLKILNGRTLNYPVFIDFEDQSQFNLGKTKSKAICEKFCAVIEKAGYSAGVYASYNYLTNKIAEINKKYVVWLAQYPKATYKGRYEIHQYSSSGTVAGIGNRIDVDTSTLSAGTYPKKSAEKETTTKTSTTKTTSTTKKTRVYPELPKKGYFTTGDKGVNVKRLQKLLVKAGYKIAVDGVYGDKTASAVRKFQKKMKITVDGVWGKKTQNAMKKALK